VHGDRMNEKIIAQFQELAKKQGATQEVVDKIPAMVEAMIGQEMFTNYTGPTPEEVNPKFFE